MTRIANQVGAINMIALEKLIEKTRKGEKRRASPPLLSTREKREFKSWSSLANWKKDDQKS